jgi:hypothetical protein
MKMHKSHLKGASIKAAIVLLPSYLAAYLTEQMVWVVPTLAAASFFAGTIQIGEAPIRRRVDEDTEDHDDHGDYDAIETNETMQTDVTDA